MIRHNQRWGIVIRKDSRGILKDRERSGIYYNEWLEVVHLLPERICDHKIGYF